MTNTIQLLTTAFTAMPLRDQHSRSSCLTGRETAMKPVATATCARLATGVILALALIAGVSATQRPAAADETSRASRQPSAVGVPPSSPVPAGRQRILADPTDRQTVDPDPSSKLIGTLYEQLMRWTPPQCWSETNCASAGSGR